MTNLEALKAKLNYPLSDNSFILALSDRGLVSTATYADRKSLELAQADLIYTLVTTPNITEGGYSISLSDKSSLMRLADEIYLKYGIRNPLRPIATFRSKM
jgi:hypothetical protein